MDPSKPPEGDHKIHYTTSNFCEKRPRDAINIRQLINLLTLLLAENLALFGLTLWQG